MAISATPPSRFEIAELIGDLFETGPADRSALLAAARNRSVRPVLRRVLTQLPDRTYHDLRDLWRELPDVPDTYDPWEELSD